MLYSSSYRPGRTVERILLTVFLISAVTNFLIDSQIVLAAGWSVEMSSIMGQISAKRVKKKRE
jgi:hypothetical protein